MSEVQPYHKKKNLFKFFKSKEFNEARVKMCALYVLLSYCIEWGMEIVEPQNGTDFSLEELRGFVGGHIEIVPLTKRNELKYQKKWKTTKK